LRQNKAQLGELLSNIAAHLNDEGLKAIRDVPRLGHPPLQAKVQLQEVIDLTASIRTLTIDMSRSVWDDIIYKNPRFQAELRQIVGDSSGNSALAQLYQLAVHKHVFRGVRAQKSESDQRSLPANPL
jgi:hypothetical protein